MLRGRTTAPLKICLRGQICVRVETSRSHLAWSTDDGNLTDFLLIKTNLSKFCAKCDLGLIGHPRDLQANYARLNGFFHYCSLCFLQLLTLIKRVIDVSTEKNFLKDIILNSQMCFGYDELVITLCHSGKNRPRNFNSASRSALASDFLNYRYCYCFFVAVVSYWLSCYKIGHNSKGHSWCVCVCSSLCFCDKCRWKADDG